MLEENGLHMLVNAAGDISLVAPGIDALQVWFYRSK